MESNSVTPTAYFMNLFITAYNVFLVIGALAANEYLIIPPASDIPSIIWWLVMGNAAMTLLVVVVVSFHYSKKNWGEVKKLIPATPLMLVTVAMNVGLQIAAGLAPFAIFTCLAYLVLFYLRFHKVPE